MQDYSISVVVPIYNEIELTKKSIIVIDKFLRKNFRLYEIIIVESGSTDGTNKICDHLDLKIKAVSVIHEKQRNGFGSALKIGFKKAKMDLVMMITVDLSFPLESILKAIPYLDKHACVLSYRSHDQRASHRHFFSFFYNLLIKIILGLRVKHVNSAFKIYKRPVIQSLKLYSNDWLIDSEIVFRLQAKKISFTEIPVRLVDRIAGKSSVGLTTPFKLLLGIIRFAIRERL